ncbi:peptidase domain-containing ABC transporter [Trinickia fusca]|uniref:Cyclolysin secretion/processing ATP-binding protein CyaB n=1 Tax=Trinickia fusca TaxID=2419777 RepID=A0A494X6M6_9BURK|nr:peptidase domain-containing ABC transporter [Trinickia fusca]RKP43413.1 peptidase domain-containing ABC transporter [Trinickia fusca]
MNLKKIPDLRFWRKPIVPLMLQTEATECGLACIAMIASYWGHETDLRNMRLRFSVSLKGITLKTLMSISTTLGLRARALRTDVKQLVSVKLPCVLHWDMNHFVVLKRIKGNTLYLNDPAVGERILDMVAVSSHYTGVALELQPSASFTPQDAPPRFAISSLIGRVVGLRRGLAAIVSLGIAMQILSMIAPFYVQWVVDEVLVASDENLLTVLALAFTLLAVMQAALFALRTWFTTTLSTDLNFQWLNNAFTHLMRLPIDFFEKRHVGDIISRFGAIQTIRRSLTNQFVDACIDGILVVGSLTIMAMYSMRLTGIALLAVVLYCLARTLLYRPLRAKTREQIIHSSKQQTHFIESTRGAQTIRLFNGAEERRAGWANLLADQMNAELDIARLSLGLQTANNLIFGIERVVVIWLGAKLALNGHFSVGMLLAFLAYKEQFSLRVAALVDRFFEFKMLGLQGERLADILLAAPESECWEHENLLDDVDSIPSVEARNVSFKYASDEPYVLKDINFCIEPGECLALTGASGSGKTTLVKILLGMLEPTEGEILVNGGPLRKVGLDNYRNLLGTVMQDDVLFSGSIADNICFFDPDPRRRRIESSARLAAVHDEITQMPMGYSTLIGNIGSGISGGQKQRVLLARALYRNPRILVLDEATSNLDVQNERLVNAAIMELGLTRILVAHRPETIAMAQRVVILDKGAIVSDTRLAV